MVRPVNKEESDKILSERYIVNPKWTICEVLRTAMRFSDAIEDDLIKDRVQRKIAEANVLANRMSRKLREYKIDYDNRWWRKKN